MPSLKRGIPPLPPLQPLPPVYIGIDPGANGGIAMIQGQRMKLLYKMPPTEADLWEIIEEVARSYNCCGGFAVLEQVGGYVGGSGGNIGSAMFKFGSSYGMCLMALTAAGIPYETWTPGKWQRAVGMTTKRKDESKTEWKQRLRAHAQRLFPGISITLATADALLIAESAKRARENGNRASRKKTIATG